MVLGGHRREDFLAADLVIVSPGVPATQPDLAAAAATGVPILGELAFAAERITAPVVAVTGTNGKSTVTHFTGLLLEAAGRRCFVGGNLGRPLSEAVLGSTAWDVVVVEVSSYQMEWPGTFAPAAACILNLTPDHLARHGTMEAYAAAKVRVFERMGPGGLAVLPAGDARLARCAQGTGGRRAWIGDLPGVRLDGDLVRLDLGQGTVHDVPLAGLSVPGRHNAWNAGVAALLAHGMGVAPGALDLGVLHALPHRMEPVVVVGGVAWINDSKATNVASAVTGLAGLDAPLVVLLGGDGKEGEDYARLAPALARARAVICFGRTGPVIARALEGLPLHTVGPMADAVALARRLARPGDAVVLSPACASFDEFRSFENRGDVFRALAREAT